MTNQPPHRPFSLKDVGGVSRSPGAPGPAPMPGKTPSAMTPRERMIKSQEHLRANQTAKALEMIKPLLKKKKPDPGALHLMACICEQERNVAGALDYAKRANTAKPNELSKLVIARALRVMGKTDESLQWTEKVLRIKPDHPVALSVKAGTLEEAGRIDEAEAVLLPLIEAVDGDLSRLPIPLRDVWARVLVQRKQYPQAIELIDAVVSQIPSTEGKVGLLHLKAKACDRSEQYDLAWEAAEQANVPGRLDYDRDLHSEQVDALIEIWAREHTEEFPITTCASAVPVFVAGMPRSGTSLIDQIIDAHPKAAGVGELSSIESFAIQLSKHYNPDADPDERFGEMGQATWQKVADSYVKQILSASPDGVERVVNKALGNNKLLGLIARLFPKTRIIHAIRDPRDVAISCFMGGFNNKMHPWTSTVEWTAHSWALSERMMNHWKETLNIPILDVHYERLVADPENEFPRLIEFLGLDFDPSCYDFHKSKRTVRTLSYDQVNRPLYTTSSGRHMNYAAHIEGINFPAYDPYKE